MKNVILLAMSTLKIVKTNCGGVLNQNSYTNELGGDKKYTGYSQLEPVTKFFVQTIYESEKKLPDKIVVLCTPKTLVNENSFFMEEIENKKRESRSQISAYSVFKEQIQRYVKEKYSVTLPDSVFVPVSIDQDQMNQGICDAAMVITKVQENRKEKVQLWLNTQGGFREITFVMIAISTLLENKYIKVRDIVSVQYQDSQDSMLKRQLHTYKILNFVSGMNEFLRYGRVDQLKEYYNGKNDSPEMPIIDEMEGFAEALQICDTRKIEETVEKLGEEIKKYEESAERSSEFFSIFLDEVKKQYGDILEKKECNGIALVKWLYENKFYQQALTYIEARIPEEIIGKEGEERLLAYKITENKQTLSEQQDKDNSKLRTRTENFLLIKIIEDIFGSKNGSKDSDDKENQGDLENAICKVKKALNDRCGLEEFKGNNKHYKLTGISLKEMRNAEVTITSDSISIELQCVLYLYKWLKDVRNELNHFDNTEKRSSFKSIKCAINLFIEVGEKLYENKALATSGSWGIE